MWVRPQTSNPSSPGQVFQFTHPCGCDAWATPLAGPSIWFQFTHPCGCDIIQRGMTPGQQRFNSRTRVGATSFVSATSLPQEFQFTHPCGCDIRTMHGQTLATGFNSRTRVGATGGGTSPPHNRKVSIHAPVWVRHHPTGNDPRTTTFQFTHSCGCDFICFGYLLATGVSIHAPVWVRHSYDARANLGNWFQFTHPCGCDRRGDKPPA